MHVKSERENDFLNSKPEHINVGTLIYDHVMCVYAICYQIDYKYNEAYYRFVGALGSTFCLYFQDANFTILQQIKHDKHVELT